MASQEMYRLVSIYLLDHGWRREEAESGWWWKHGASSEATIGGALEDQLEKDEIDTRKMLPGEPQEFWGTGLL